MSASNSYCVYGHYDDSGKVFYVGAGSKQRAKDFSKSHRNVDWDAHVKTFCTEGRPQVKIWHQSLSKESAHEHEKFWIGCYGRREEGGVLINKSLGGIGGATGCIRSEVTRQKQSVWQKGKTKPPSMGEKVGTAQRGTGKGYTFIPRIQKFQGSIHINGVKHHLGYFASESEAREAYVSASDTYKNKQELPQPRPKSKQKELTYVR